MPRSRSSSMESSSCGRWSRGSTAPVSSRMRSASVDFPWSMWAMIEKLRMLLAGAAMRPSSMAIRSRPAEPAARQPSGAAPRSQQIVDLLLLAHDHVLQPVLDGLRRRLAAGWLDGRLECLQGLAVVDEAVERGRRVAGEAQWRHVGGRLAAQRRDLLDEPGGVLELGRRVPTHL